MSTYIPNDVYDRIVNSVAALGTHTPSEIKIAMGEGADCWPDRIRLDVALTLYRELEARHQRRADS